MDTEIGPDTEAKSIDARPHSGVCPNATASGGPERATPSQLVVARRDLIAKLRRERYDLNEVETPGGLELVGEERARATGHREGYNAHADELIAWLSQGDVAAGLVELVANAPRLASDEQNEILQLELRDHLRTLDEEQRERARQKPWAFEFDIEHDAICDAYARELGGESG